MATVPSGGDLIKGFNEDGMVRGDAKGFGAYSESVDFGTTVGADLGQDATNRVGAADGTKSDPMFARVKHEGDQPNRAMGSESPESVGSKKMSGAGSDPMND